jgi:hypothetical protein
MYVYIFDFGDLIKIGKTYNVKQRRNYFERVSGREILREFSIEAEGKYESLMHKELSEHRGRGEYFKFSYEEAVSLLQKLVQDGNSKTELSPLVPKLDDFYVRIQKLIKEKDMEEKTDTSLEDFMKSLNINYNEFFKSAQKQTAFLEESVKVARALGVSLEYLITGEKQDFEPVIWQLESAIEELKKL